MIEVLRKPRVSDPKVEFTCKGCKSRLRAKRSEGRHFPHDRDGASYAFKCPQCRQENWIAESVFNRQR